MSGKKLYKDSSNKMIAGVCAGLADYFNLDVSLVRVVFAVLAFVGVGSPFLIYLILWIVLPEKPAA